MPSTDSVALDPALNVPPDDTPEGHRIRSRTLWALARYDYLQGDSAPQVCDRYGLNESTLRDRARREKWRRVDQPDPDPAEEDEDDSPVDCAALADDALIRVRRALKRGRAGEAASWMRLHEKLVNRLADLAEIERRSRRVDSERGAHPHVDPLEQAIEAARRKAGVNLAALVADLGGDPSQPFPDFDGRNADAVLAGALSHLSHPDFPRSDPEDDLGHLDDPDDLDPP